MLHQGAKLLFNIHVPYVSDYLDPLMAMPIILTLLLWERKYFLRWKDYVRLNLTEVLSATALVTLVAEVFFPYLSADFTADWWDVLFFFIGAAIFYLTINPKQSTEKWPRQN